VRPASIAYTGRRRFARSVLIEKRFAFDLE
jgi:hypothetical protein